MNPLIAGPLIKGGLGILGAMLDRRASRRDQANYWVAHREASEKAGFNPLATLGMTPQVSGMGLGSALSDAGLLLADNLANKPMRELQIEEMQLRNAELTERVKQLTFRPEVGGPWGGGDVPHASQTKEQGFETSSEVSSRSSVDASSFVPSDSGDFLLDPRRIGQGFVLGDRRYYPSVVRSNVEHLESEYGDIVGAMAGLGYAAHDLSSFVSEKMRYRAFEIRQAEERKKQKTYTARRKDDFRAPSKYGRVVPNPPGYHAGLSEWQQLNSSFEFNRHGVRLMPDFP